MTFKQQQFSRFFDRLATATFWAFAVLAGVGLVQEFIFPQYPLAPTDYALFGFVTFWFVLFFARKPKAYIAVIDDNIIYHQADGTSQTFDITRHQFRQEMYRDMMVESSVFFYHKLLLYNKIDYTTTEIKCPFLSTKDFNRLWDLIESRQVHTIVLTEEEKQINNAFWAENGHNKETSLKAKVAIKTLLACCLGNADVRKELNDFVDGLDALPLDILQLTYDFSQQTDIYFTATLSNSPRDFYSDINEFATDLMGEQCTLPDYKEFVKQLSDNRSPVLEIEALLAECELRLTQIFVSEPTGKGSEFIVYKKADADRVKMALALLSNTPAADKNLKGN